jgi:hypothetical protein
MVVGAVALITRPFGRRGFTPRPVHLLGRGPDLLSFRGGMSAFGGALTALTGRPLCNSSLPFFSIYTTTVVRCVVAPAATTLRLFPRGRTSTGEVEFQLFDCLSM